MALDVEAEIMNNFVINNNNKKKIFKVFILCVFRITDEHGTTKFFFFLV